MITKEQVIEYLNTVTEAWKTLQSAELPIFNWHPSTPYCKGDRLALFDLDKILDVLGYPKVRKHFSDDADQYVLHWKGVEVYDLVYPPRIGAKKEVRQ